MEDPQRKDTGEPPKKGSLDSLGREDLVKKCKSLVATLMKAKQDKDAMLTRTRELEETVGSFEEQKSADKNALKAMQEIVDALTEQKLQMTGQVQELQDKGKQLEKVVANNAELTIENDSLKRQLKRITDENDDLIAEVNTMEGKLMAVNSVGEEQQKHFLELEQSTNKMLEVQGKYEEAKKNIDHLEEDKRHLQAKMKAYKGKIIEIVAKFKKLRASHKATLEVVTEYSNSIPNWQEELRRVAEVINRNHKERKMEEEGNRRDETDSDKSPVTAEKDQRRINELTAAVDELRRQLESNRKIMSQVEAEKLTIIDDKTQFEGKFMEVEKKLLAKKQENSDLLQEMKELNEIMKDRGETISKQQSELSQTKQSNEELKGDLQKIQSILSERDQTICALIEQNKTKDKADDVASTSTVSKLDDSMNSAKDNCEVNEEKYSKLKAMAVKLKKRLDEEMQKVKALEESQTVARESTEQVEKLERSLSEVVEREKVSKLEAEKYKGFAKKYNMLALEMESYENSMEAQEEKLQQKQKIIKELEQTIEEQKGTMTSLKEQMRLVEERSSSEVNHSQGLHDQINKLTASVRELEHQRAENRERMEGDEKEISDLNAKLEGMKQELEGLKKDKDNHQESVELERDSIRSTCSDLEVQLRSATKRLSEKEEECVRLAKEYSGYKIRAQSILQQSQTQVNSREKELEDELETVKRLIKSTEQNLNASQDRVKELEKCQQSFGEEKERNANRFADLLSQLDTLKQSNQQLKMENRQTMEEQQNSLKSHRLNVDTLTSVFKSQIEELENKLRDQENMVKDLSASNRMQGAKLESIAKRSSTDEEKIVEMRLNLERQMQEDNNGISLRGINNSHPPHMRMTRKVSSNSGLMPLEDLLNSNFDEEQEGDYGASSVSYPVSTEDEKKMQAKESQIRHLSTLLSEAEQDVAKLSQQNDLLKEEIRRQQRSEERDAHIHNSEYLKNVIFKFMTTKEEKIHLVPVLTTILKLSPAEVQKLQAAAKGNTAGDSPRSGWTNYLPFKK